MGGGGGSTLHTYKGRIKDREDTVSPRYNAVEPGDNEGPRDWQNLFAITRFPFHIFYYYWGEENRSLY